MATNDCDWWCLFAMRQHALKFAETHSFFACHHLEPPRQSNSRHCAHTMLDTSDEPGKLKITLESSEQYDDWLDELSGHVRSRPLWNIMTKDDSGEFLIEEPSCFKFQDFDDLPAAISGQPPTPQQASYEAALEANSMHRELFIEQENEKHRIQRLIYHSVPKLIQHRLSWSRGLREWMVVIEEEMKPEPYVMEQATLE